MTSGACSFHNHNAVIMTVTIHLTHVMEVNKTISKVGGEEDHSAAQGLVSITTGQRPEQPVQSCSQGFILSGN